jgi:hypothetical protein
MEIKTLHNGEEVIFPRVNKPKQINRNMDDLKLVLSYMVNNIKVISFMEKYIKSGK